MRSTNGPASRKRRKRWLKAAKGFWLRRSKLYRYAKDALDHGRQYAYRVCEAIWQRVETRPPTFLSLPPRSWRRVSKAATTASVTRANRAVPLPREVPS